MGTRILTLYLFLNPDFRLVRFFMFPEMASIITIFTKNILSSLLKPIRTLFWNLEKFSQILVKFVLQKLEYVPNISGFFLCYLVFSIFIETLKRMLPLLFQISDFYKKF